MQLISDSSALRRTLAILRFPAEQSIRRVALVPTMGNLHEGHLSLIKQAREHADIVIATVFVNPLQFGVGEDFDQYPRTLEADADKLAGAGCDILFAPAADELFPSTASNMTHVTAGAAGRGLCGAKRPGHFDGVVTIISLLFNLVQPDTAVFGEKDYQQLQVIRALVRDLHFPVEIIGAPIVRNHDGLALSSRNAYLSDTERATAPSLYRTLMCIRELLEQGLSHAQAIEEGIRQLDAQGFTADYLELRDRYTLAQATTDTRDAILLAAAYLGTTRLLDNVNVDLPASVEAS